MRFTSKSPTSGSEKSPLRFYPFDLRIQRIPFEPSEGHLLITIYGALVRVVRTGELRMVYRGLIRARNDAGKVLPLEAFGREYLRASAFEAQNIACLLDWIREHLGEYVEMLQNVEEAPPNAIERLSLRHPEVARTATGVPRHLRTPLDFPIPDKLRV